MRNNSKFNISNINLTLSILQIVLVLIPFGLIYLLGYYSDKDPDISFMLGFTLILLSIPMGLVLLILSIYVIISSIFKFRKGIEKVKNLTSIIISIIVLLISIGGMCYYFETMIELIDTISRLG